jgi:NADH:ubiquinone reductase (H+-translocating)
LGAVHIFYLIGSGNRVLVMLEWLWAYLTFRRGARLITGPAPLLSSGRPADRPESRP